MKVFVYGTLQSGYGNHRLLSGCDLVDRDTVSGYKLYYAGFPVATSNEGTEITGEVYHIPEVIEKSILYNLDALEGEGVMYNRISVTTNEGHECFMYVGVPKFWDDFDGMRDCDNEEGVYTWRRL